MVTKPTGRPNGRPPLAYDPEIGSEICDAISNGAALYKVCKVPGYPSLETAYNWLRESPDFAEKYALARELQQDRAADEIVEVARSEPDPQRARVLVDAIKWRASKLAPKKYGDRVDMNLTATIENIPQEQIDARLTELLGKAGTALAALRDRAQAIEEQTIDLPAIREAT
jgi:hypothetical protein